MKSLTIKPAQPKISRYMILGFLGLTFVTHVFGLIPQPSKKASPFSANAKRIAIVIGANNGGEGRGKLRYAHRDAKSFAQVLTELGGVEKTDVTLILEPSPKSLREELNRSAETLRGHKGKFRRTEIVLYYSGHADESGLLLTQGKFSYQELKKSFRDLEADVKIAILDACASGAFTRLKGGVKKPAFLMDESLDMQGYAILTSNSEDEPAQESERIQGSYFTNSLVTGLRGAADMTGDNRVTLNEAYQYAFHQTLAHTEETQAGAQHAGYDIQLKGSGEVVMSELNPASAVVVLEKNMEGKVSMRDSSGNLVIELVKNKSRAMEIGLYPGMYRILLDTKKGPKLARVKLVEGKAAQLKLSHFKNISNKEAYRLRGKGDSKFKEEIQYDSIPVSFAVIPSISRKNGKLVLQPSYHNYSFNLLVGGYAKLNGIGIGLIGEWAYEDVYGGQFSGFLNVAGDSVKGGQGSGYANYAKNVVGGQGAGFLNIALNVKGGQGAGFLNIAGGLKGGQGAGFLNITGELKGVQGAGFLNVAGEAKGVQGAGFSNISKSIKGTQGAGFMNVSGDVKGVQISGFLNIARKLKGYQVGFINLAQSVEGETIGVLNLNKNSKISPVIWMDETRTGFASLKTGSGNFYGLLHIGINLDADLAQYISHGFGFGYGHNFGSVIWNSDINFLEMQALSDLEEDWALPFKDNQDKLIKIRSGSALNIHSHFRPEIGLSLNILYDHQHKNKYQNYISTWEFGDHNQVKIWPGFYAALNF